MDETNDLETRIRKLGMQPVDPATASRHLTQMAIVGAGAPRRSRLRAALAGSLMAGTLLGGASLAGAMTGALPDTAQAAAHTALAKVGVHVPDAASKGKDASTTKADNSSNGTARFTTGCTNPDGSAFTGNHGQYVKAHPDDSATADVNEREQAAQSDCGKPLTAVTNATNGDKTDANDTSDANESKSSTAPKGGQSSDHKPATTPSSAGNGASHSSGKAPTTKGSSGK